MMNRIVPITGSFLDGIACDIPANNWTRELWRAELEDEKALGIDTLIVIRTGWKDSAMYDSPVMRCTLHDPDDLLEFLLAEADRLALRVYVGLFDTGNYWLLNDWDNEVEINSRLIDELETRYLHHPSFYGWYLSHEGDMKFHQEKIWKPLARKMRADTPDKKILISPRYAGTKYEPRFAVTPELHVRHFRYIYEQLDGLIDQAAFMDGHVEFRELPDFLAATQTVCEEYGIEFWSNLETFDRDMPWHFPPIEWSKMLFKLEAAQPYVRKIVTFEAPHFLSRHSCYPAAARLRECYRHYLEQPEHAAAVSPR